MNAKQLTTKASNHWSIIVGLVLGAVFIPIFQDEWAAWRMERNLISEQGTPVVQASAEIIKRDHDSVVLHVTGTKLRDCKLVGTQAYSVMNKVMSLARMERVYPFPLEYVQRPVGPFDMGHVRVWPVGSSAHEVVLYALHTCGAQTIEVRSTLARVALNDDS